MFGLIARSDSTRGVTTARAVPVTVTVTAGTNAADGANARRRREHIQIDPDLWRQMVASNAGLALRNQVVLTIGAYSVPLTVEILETQSSITTVRIGAEALARFPGQSLPASGTLTAYAPSTGISDATAQSTGAYYEYLVDNGSNTNTVLVACHGGNIEIGTDTWADEMKVALDAVGKTSTIWGARGYGSGSQDSYNRHHISSVDTDYRLNPMLGTVFGRGFARCIGFHGQSGTNRIDLGCDTAENTFVDGLVTSLQARGELAGVTIARTEDTEIAGTAPNNIGNRLAAHYVQIEATLNVRQSSSMRGALVSVFASAYAPL